MTSTLPLRMSIELARAYNLTPPPDDKTDVEPSPTRLLHSKCLLQTHEKILEIHKRLNIAEHSYSEEILHRARSTSYDQVSCADLHDDIQHLTEELEGVGNKVDTIDERLGNIHDSVAKLDSDRIDKYNELMSHLDSVDESLGEQIKSIEERWEEELKTVKKTIGALKERMQNVEERLRALEVRVSIVEEKLDILDGTVSTLNMMRQNTSASRMNDPVNPIRIVRRSPDGNIEVFTEPSRRVRWYWKLYREDRRTYN
jgi:predicted ribosome quality control (RQC) complex YloA/Tae2 family protein